MYPDSMELMLTWLYFMVTFEILYDELDISMEMIFIHRYITDMTTICNNTAEKFQLENIL